jgi:tripartite-type tricarboxylate transporter receptor subunit TctC
MNARRDIVVKLRRRSVWCALVLATGATLCAGGVGAQGAAQSYPSRPLRLILPYPPGGPTDIMGRMAADVLIRNWGAQVIADNRPGFNGNIGAALCAKSTNDGYTMCTVSGAQTVAPSLYKRNLGFDPQKDFSHVALLASLPTLLLVHPSVPANNVQELIALAKSKPGALNYASTGVGVTPQLIMEMFKLRAGIDIVNITYKGAVAALVDQVSGRVQTAFSITVGAIPFVKQGKLRALAVSTKERFPALPDVPTVDESGLRGFEGSSWQGISMPAGVPGDIVAKMNAELVRALQTPELKERLLDMGGLAASMSPAEYAAFFRNEIDKWGKVVREAKVKGE